MKRVRLPKKVREALKAWRRLLKDDDVVRAHHELAIRWIRSTVEARQNGMSTVLQASWCNLTDDQREQIGLGYDALRALESSE